MFSKFRKSAFYNAKYMQANALNADLAIQWMEYCNQTILIALVDNAKY